MSDVPVYIVANLKVEDPEVYRRYEKGFFPILKRHGGEFITYDDNIIPLEGTLDGRVILFRFPSEQAAKAWFADPDYQEISEYRRAGTTTRYITIVHGLPPRK